MNPRGAFDEQRSVLEWGDAVRRDLPWRHTREPWAILVAEVMLAQTQVARVEPKWFEFLARWPDVAAAADASLADVLEVWQGLGYPRRARNLVASARMIVAEFGGRFPDSVDSLMALPGIGPYTARAVMAFAFEADVAVVDTNVGRVLARRSGRRLTAKDAQLTADSLVPVGSGWAWNQSMLDLGAMCCRPTRPNCAICPIAGVCAWHEAGTPEPDPARGSAAVSTRQSRFEGSDRQARGRALAATAAGPIGRRDLLSALDWPDDAAHRSRLTGVVDSLVSDGLVEVDEANRVRRTES